MPPAKRSGPHLIAAKLSRLSTKGESAPKPFRFALPNDGRALYGKRARFRLRVYTTGGFSPDGVRAVFPTEFSRYFRLDAKGKGGRDVVLRKANHTYRIAGHRLRVLGLADLGPKQSSYDGCYREDKDNYVDIVIAGQRAAVRRITDVEIPASGSLAGQSSGATTNRSAPSGLCAEAGLVRAGVIAVDGSKFAAAASDGAIRTYEEIAAEVLAEARNPES